MKTENDNKYRRYLIKTLVCMEEMHDTLHNCLINLAMSGELKEVDNHFEEGDVMTFKRSDFEKLADQNIRHTVSALDAIFDIYETIKNINNISAEEIREDFHESENSDDEDLPF